MERYAQLFQWEFGSKYSKSFLQHHSKKLLKYYSKMKSLLEVKGFSWDEMQQKIAAEDYVWGNYTSLLYPFGFWNSFLLYFTTTIVDIGTPRCLFVKEEDHAKLIFGNAVRNLHSSYLYRSRLFRFIFWVLLEDIYI